VVFTSLLAYGLFCSAPFGRSAERPPFPRSVSNVASAAFSPPLHFIRFDCDSARNVFLMFFPEPFGFLLLCVWEPLRSSSRASSCVLLVSLISPHAPTAPFFFVPFVESPLLSRSRRPPSPMCCLAPQCSLASCSCTVFS